MCGLELLVNPKPRFPNASHPYAAWSTASPLPPSLNPFPFPRVTAGLPSRSAYPFSQLRQSSRRTAPIGRFLLNRSNPSSEFIQAVHRRKRFPGPAATLHAKPSAFCSETSRFRQETQSEISLCDGHCARGLSFCGCRIWKPVSWLATAAQ